MGISGLTSFMDREYLDEILEEIKLKNCKLLVDGYGLLYRVHSNQSLQSAHGGNYDELVNSLSEIFYSFKKCNIDAIFLLDGGREKSDRKLRTQLKRANQRIRQACSLTNYANPKKGKISKINLDSIINSNYQTFSNLLPILAFKIYQELMDKFEIKHFQCTFEADYDLACLANELGCPLLSSDSDFYVYDLKNGYIPIDYFYASGVTVNEESSEHYIPAYVYKIDKFLEHLNKNKVEKGDFFRKEMLPIFAIILGNDYVEKTTFASLLKSFDSSNNNLRYFKAGKNPANYVKKKDNFYLKIIKWLAQFDSVSECVDILLQTIKIDNHDVIRQVIDESITEYMCKKPSFANYFKRLVDLQLESQLENLSLGDEEIINSEITTFNGDLIDRKFLKNFIHFKTTRYCLDVLIHRKTVFSCQIEVADWPSSFSSSVEIRKFYYTMLFKLFDTKSLSSNEPIIIHEYSRHQRNLKIYDVNLSEENDLFLSIDQSSINTEFFLKNLFHLDNETSSNIIVDRFNEKFLCKKLKNLFAMIYFWFNSGRQDGELQVLNDSKDLNFIRAFMVSIIKSCVIDPCYSEIKNHPILTEVTNNIKRFESNNSFLINEYLSLDEDQSQDFLKKFKTFIVSNPNNYGYIKDLRIRLIQFSSVFNQNLNINKKSNWSKIDRLLDLKVVHCLSEFQAIYLSTFYAQTVLNDLHPNDFEILSLNYFFNGTFLHNFKEELDHRVNPDLYIEELFGRQSLFKELYYELFDYFTDLFKIKREPNSEVKETIEQTNVDCVVNNSPKKITKNARKNLKKKLKKMAEETLKQKTSNENMMIQ